MLVITHDGRKLSGGFVYGLGGYYFNHGKHACWVAVKELISSYHSTVR